MGRQYPTYEECYAYIILREIVGLNDIELFDKPDILSKNNTLGIEVFYAWTEDENRFETIMERRHFGKKADPLPEGYEEKPQYIIHPIRSSYDNDIRIKLAAENIEKKLHKKKQYAHTEKFELFISLNLYGSRDEIESICRNLFACYNSRVDGIYFNIHNENYLIYCSNSNIQKCYDYDECQNILARKALREYNERNTKYEKEKKIRDE